MGPPSPSNSLCPMSAIPRAPPVSEQICLSHLSAGPFYQAHRLPPSYRPPLLLHQVGFRDHCSRAPAAVAGPAHELRLGGAGSHHGHLARPRLQRGGAPHSAHRAALLPGHDAHRQVPDGVCFHRNVSERWQGEYPLSSALSLSWFLLALSLSSAMCVAKSCLGSVIPELPFLPSRATNIRSIYSCSIVRSSHICGPYR